MVATRALCCLVLAAVAAPKFSADHEEAFGRFMAQHGRTYEVGSEEHQRRLALFVQRSELVDAINAAGGRWRAAVSDLSDWTEEEQVGLMGTRPGSEEAGGLGEQSVGAAAARLPDTVDWSYLTSAQDVPSQGSCGSCWAVTAAAILTMHSEISANLWLDDEWYTFSAQELVDCVPNPRRCGGTGGCHGATIQLALGYAVEHGTESALQVPYEGVEKGCRRSSLPGTLAARPLGLESWRQLPRNRYAPVLEAVARQGPLGISLAAGGWSLYSHGVFDDCGTVINHGVVLMGYGEEGADLYWLIRNSWGAGWGEHGFIRLERHADDEQRCGMDRSPLTGVACPGDRDSEEVQVCGSCGVIFDASLPIFT